MHGRDARRSRHHGRLRRVAASVLTAVAMLAIVAGAAAAAQGVRLDLGAISVDRAIAPGADYILPVVGVSNAGTEPSTYRMRTTPLSDTPGATFADRWVTFDPPVFDLAPGAHQAVKVRIVIPIDAEQGRYAGLLVAAVDTPATQASGAVGAAAGARLTFTVAPSTGLDALWRSLARWATDAMPWLGLVVALVGVALLAIVLRRRFDVHLDVRRRR